MIGIEIEDSALARQLQALEGFEPALRQEFAYAGERTGQDMKRDMRGGVGKVSGRLADGISGAVRPQAGVDVDLIMGSTAANKGYDYGARLDKDGRMVCSPANMPAGGRGAGSVTRPRARLSGFSNATTSSRWTRLSGKRWYPADVH